MLKTLLCIRRLLPFALALFGLLTLGLAPAASAQSPPDTLTLVVQGPNAISVDFTPCRISTADNCTNFVIYRDPPGLNIPRTGVEPADYASISYLDTGLTPSTKYTYLVCSGNAANSSKSNCLEASATTMKAPSSGGSGNDSGTGPAPYTNNSPPPTNLQATAGGVSVLLSWTNPPNSSEWIEIRRAITGGTAAQPIKRVTSGTSRYADQGPLTPHDPYIYWVCTGTPDASMRSCAQSRSVTIWGANPVLTATRTTPTTVRLSVAVDNLPTLVGLKVTRQGGNDPCRQGTTMANGGQGCKTTTVGPGGAPVNAPIITTVYQLSPGDSLGSNSTSPPWVIDIPDDTVTAGVEYYYSAAATWGGPLEQDSQTVTVPATLQFSHYRQKILVKSGVSLIHVQAAQNKAGTTSVGEARAEVKTHPNDAQALYRLGQAYCAQKQRDACISTMYLGFLQSQKAGSTALTNQIRRSLAAEGVTVTETK